MVALYLHSSYVFMACCLINEAQEEWFAQRSNAGTNHRICLECLRRTTRDLNQDVRFKVLTMVTIEWTIVRDVSPSGLLERT
jgi:hypothetical protein